LLAICSQKAVLEITSARIMYFLRFSIAIIPPKTKKNRQISIHGSSRIAKNIQGLFKILVSYLACSQICLNLPVNHHHFGYITKLTPKKKE
jgi:hypothetical protein